MLKTLVIGNGVSGKSACKLLKKLGYRTYVLDDNKKYKLELIKDRLFKDLSFIVVSPGVNLNHELIKEAKKQNIRVIGELELGFKYLKGKVIAITGTNGKTTTTTLVGEILRQEGAQVFVGGNIGNAVSSFCLSAEETDVTVLDFDSEREQEIFDEFNRIFNDAGYNDEVVKALEILCNEQMNDKYFMQNKTGEQLAIEIMAKMGL